MKPFPLRLLATRLAVAGTLGALAACADRAPFAPDTPASSAASPSVAAPASASPLVITELMPDPSRVADAQGEYIELFNPNDVAVDIGGWRLASGPANPPSETHTIAAGTTIPACGYLVLANNANPATNGGISGAYSYGTSITLNNSNTDWVTLKDAGGALVDSVAYSQRTGGTIVAPGASPTSGASWVVGDAGTDNAVIQGNANWSVTRSGTTYGAGDRGTPGSGGYACTPPGPVGEVVSVTVTPDPAAVVLGATRALSATARDAGGNTVPVTLAWRSDDESIATVSATGVVTGVRLGTTTVRATAPNGVFGTATVNVTEPNAPATITLVMNAPARVPVGFTKPVFATVRDAGGSIISPPPTLTWTSSDERVATVDALGYVTAVSTGTVTIRATAANGVFGTVGVTLVAGDAPTPAVYRDHLEFGEPLPDTRSIWRSTIRIDRRQFVAGYREARGGPAWVSWNLNASQFGDAPRCDCFSAEPLLPPGTYRVVDFDYRGSGYDRGHMVQSESRTTTEQENAATFLLSNILPQANENNAGPWLGFENWLNDRARTDGRELYVVAGGQYEAAPPTLKGEGRVQVPSWTWKVAVILPAGQGLGWVTSPDRIEVVAVRMPNRIEPGVPGSAVGIRGRPWQEFAVSVDQVEAWTGYDLLRSLPDDIEAIVEARVFGAPTVAPRLARRP